MTKKPSRYSPCWHDVPRRHAQRKATPPNKLLTVQGWEGTTVLRAGNAEKPRRPSSLTHVCKNQSWQSWQGASLATEYEPPEGLSSEATGLWRERIVEFGRLG